MKSDSIAFGVAGIAFGLIAGWIIGTQQARPAQPSQPVASSSSSSSASANTRAAIVDDAKVNAL